VTNKHTIDKNTGPAFIARTIRRLSVPIILKQEIGAGLKTGIIRSMGGTGKVVTSAGLVFAFTTASMAVSELRVLGQVGTTIGLGLLFNTLVVRSFMTPSIAALLGRWFWWPVRVRPRPASAVLRPLFHDLPPLGAEPSIVGSTTSFRQRTRNRWVAGVRRPSLRP
jgi:hypothetical protein